MGFAQFMQVVGFLVFLCLSSSSANRDSNKVQKPKGVILNDRVPADTGGAGGGPRITGGGGRYGDVGWTPIVGRPIYAGPKPGYGHPVIPPRDDVYCGGGGGGGGVGACGGHCCPCRAEPVPSCPVGCIVDSGYWAHKKLIQHNLGNKNPEAQFYEDVNSPMRNRHNEHNPDGPNSKVNKEPGPNRGEDSIIGSNTEENNNYDHGIGPTGKQKVTSEPYYGPDTADNMKERTEGGEQVQEGNGPQT